MTEYRDIAVLRLHPDSKRVPMADRADLNALRSSLQENGQQDPIDVTADNLILDGRTRWTLLKELGALSIQVRVVEVPERDQTHYIVDRALARRHLSAEQKRALNALLRELVVEVALHPTTGREVQVGRGQTQRAETLGVTRETVRQWDAEEPPARNLASSPPSHFRGSDGRLQPIHPVKESRGPRQSRPPLNRPAPLRKSRPIPSWSRHFSTWCRAARPEDREFLRRLDREVHAALERNGVPCQKEGAA